MAEAVLLAVLEAGETFGEIAALPTMFHLPQYL